MARETGGISGGQTLSQIKRVSVRSNAPGHANGGVVAAGNAPAKPAFVVKDTVTLSTEASGKAKPAR